MMSEEELVSFSDSQAQRLVRLYTQAEKEVLREISRGLLKGNNISYQKQVLANVQAILADLNKGARSWSTSAVEKTYMAASQNVEDDLKAQGMFNAKRTFGAIHQQAMSVLADNAFDRLENISQVIGRKTNDIYRNAALDAVRGTVGGYETWKQVAQKYKEKLADEGVTGFVDRSGRAWDMTTYSEMVARTTTMEAHLQGTSNRLLEQGYDLVKISTHNHPCDLCSPWQGKILSLTGQTPGYPTLEEARMAKLFHPNCRHAYGLFFDLDAAIAKLEKDSGGRVETNKGLLKKLTSPQIEGSLFNKTGLSKFEDNIVEFTAGNSPIPDISEKLLTGRKLTPFETKNKDEAEEFLAYIDAAPAKNSLLYRVESGVSRNLSLKVGDKYISGVRSFSSSKQFVKDNLESDEFYENPVVFKTVGNVKSLNIEAYSSFKGQHESVTAGQFEVMSIVRKETHREIVVRQVKVK